MTFVNNIESYFKDTPPDCSLISQDNYEIPIHKELLYQTKYMQEMCKSVEMDPCYSKIEIICPSLVKEEIDIIVHFLYSGKILCTDQSEASQVSKDLTQLFGFPKINIDSNTNNVIEQPSLRKRPQKRSVVSNSVHRELTETVVKKEVEDFDNVVSTYTVFFAIFNLYKINCCFFFPQNFDD